MIKSLFPTISCECIVNRCRKRKSAGKSLFLCADRSAIETLPVLPTQVCFLICAEPWWGCLTCFSYPFLILTTDLSLYEHDSFADSHFFRQYSLHCAVRNAQFPCDLDHRLVACFHKLNSLKLEFSRKGAKCLLHSLFLCMENVRFSSLPSPFLRVKTISACSRNVLAYSSASSELLQSRFPFRSCVQGQLTRNQGLRNTVNTILFSQAKTLATSAIRD